MDTSTDSQNQQNNKRREEVIISVLVLAFFAWLSIQLGMFDWARPDAVLLDSDSATGMSDLDSDGIADTADKCPIAYGPAENAGCPPAASERKPEVASSDRADDYRPAQAGTAAAEPSAPKKPETITEPEAALAETAAQTEPPASEPEPAKVVVADRDADGVPDNRDACPDVAGIIAGCPADADGDGFADHEDACPDKAAADSDNGCPEVVVSEAEQAVISEAVSSVAFISGSSTLTQYSQGLLDKVARLLTNKPNYRLRIHGHTDSQGDADANQQLSEARALACANYLARQGVARARMSHAGYGETQPLADNSTEDGRRKNRRVEFELHY